MTSLSWYFLILNRNALLKLLTIHQLYGYCSSYYHAGNSCTPQIVFEPDQIRIQKLACCRVQITKILVITEALIDFDTDNLRRHILKDHCNFDQSSADRHEIKVNIEDGLRQMIY